VKRYADEPGSVAVRAVGVLVAAELSLVEVPAALWRKHRSGALGEEDTRLLSRLAATEMAGRGTVVISLVAALPATLAEAVTLVERHGLRAYDAVQLACALAARRADPGIGVFGCADRDLARAGAREGFDPLPGLA
jgi:hypothetical protein